MAASLPEDEEAAPAVGMGRASTFVFASSTSCSNSNNFFCSGAEKGVGGYEVGASFLRGHDATGVRYGVLIPRKQ